MEIILVCSGGMSASIFMKKLNQLAKEQDITFTLSACSAAQMKPCDIMLLSPQVAYLKKQAMAYVKEEVGIIQIQNYDYASLHVEPVLTQIKAWKEGTV